MSEYQSLVRDEAKKFLADLGSTFDDDAGEHGGRSKSPNFSLWLDRTGRLNTRLTELSQGWARTQIELIKSNSRNALGYGDPKESAYLAFHRDVLQELKKLRKHKGGV